MPLPLEIAFSFVEQNGACSRQGSGGGAPRPDDDPSGQGKDLSTEWHDFVREHGIGPGETSPRERELVPLGRGSRSRPQKLVETTIKKGDPEFQYITAVLSCVVKELKSLPSRPGLILGDIQRGIGSTCGKKTGSQKGYAQMSTRLDQAFKQSGLEGQRKVVAQGLMAVLKLDAKVVGTLGQLLYRLVELDVNAANAVYGFVFGVLIYIFRLDGKGWAA
ncbi:MAG: hypothetical protein M1816_004271 [Peltula sp. TS41687]|nr:MAG: hypothetical protein M1816_004271 [Peltula sp. TS41687]